MGFTKGQNDPSGLCPFSVFCFLQCPRKNRSTSYPLRNKYKTIKGNCSATFQTSSNSKAVCGGCFSFGNVRFLTDE